MPHNPAMKIHPLTVGPIVGETTARRVRIWGRGDAHVFGERPRRCFGLARHRPVGGKWSDPILFKMNPNFDLTGIAILPGLEPETRYDYEVGYFFADVEIEDVRVAAIDWRASSRGSLTTASEDDTKGRTLAIGSCRYLLKTFLGSFFDSRGDKTFRSILRLMDDGVDIDQVIMMGDQIYADDLSAVSPDRTITKFYERYRDAFSQPYIQQLMSCVPTYMTLDDHEIEDNWPGKASERDWKTLFPIAIHAYQAYQLSHGPCIPIARGRLTGTPDHLWSKYTDGCCDVFLTDSRTERYLVDGAREMLSQTQLRALKRWLADDSGRVKIVVTSVPFFPDAVSPERHDKWAGFADQRSDILGHIESKKIRRVVFFSGDVHASFSGQLISPSGLKITSVVSSSFFWPYPHPGARHFQRRGTLDGGKAGTFKLANVSRVIADDNFTLVRVTRTRIKADVYSRKGRALASHTLSL